MKKVQILCTGNSARSQMAEVLWRTLGDGEWEAYSAGSRPTGRVHPLAIAALREAGHSVAGLRSKHVAEFVQDHFDLVITVCDHAKESCPVLPGIRQAFHWPFDDPAACQGSFDEQQTQFRRVRDEIAAKIRNYLNQHES